MKKQDIIDILREFDRSSVNELKLKLDNTEVELSKNSSEPAKYEPKDNTVELPKPAPKVKKEEEEVSSNNYIVEAPIVATFYESPSPNEPVFIKEGDKVEKDQVLFILEAMKMFNEIKSPVAGTVVRIFPQDGDLVEYGEKIVEIQVD